MHHNIKIGDVVITAYKTPAIRIKAQIEVAEGQIFTVVETTEKTFRTEGPLKLWWFKADGRGVSALLWPLSDIYVRPASVGDQIIEGLKEAVAFSKGEIECKVHVVKIKDDK